MIFLAAVAFAIAALMHLFSWGHGVIDVTLFELLGLLSLALAGWRGPEWPFRRP